MNENWPIAIAQGWHAVAACSELSAVKPLSRMLMGVPLVVFGDELSAAVLTDRCPHRGVRLSGG